MFNQIYKRTDELEAESMLQELGFNIPVGTYNNGLLTVVDNCQGKKVMAEWDWYFNERCIALITTGIGDVFFWKRSSEQIFYLDPQNGEPEFIDTEINWFLNEFLTNEQIIDDVIWKGKIDELINEYRPLNYLEAFILKPWRILGGIDKISNYEIGTCDVYLSLVGQTHKQVKS